MSIRSDLLTQITTNLASHTNIRVSDELPFNTSGKPLYQQNMKFVYVDEEELNVEQLYRTLDQSSVNTTVTTVNAYLSVDAKNQLSDINTVVANILSARNTISSTIDSTSDYETDIEDDVITYTFEYNFTTI
jgi:hypothetical protein